MQSENIADLAAALVTAQAEMDNAHLNQTNPHFRSKFADLAAVRKATLPILNKHGLGITQQTMLCEHGFVLVTRLVHKSGQSIEAIYPLPVNEKPQQIGSAITYARRYSWAAMCGIAADEDDDGNAAQEGAGKRRSSYSIKQKAAKGEGDEWGEFMATLEAADTAAKVDALQKLMEQATFPNWPVAYVESAKEELDKRRDVLADAPTMQSKADYVRECHEIIDGATDAATLKKWWESEANARKRFSFTQSDVDDQRARIAGKLQELTVLNKPTVVAADALADAMEQ